MSRIDSSLLQKNKNKMVISLVIIAIASLLSSYVGSLFAFISPSMEFRWQSSVSALQPTYSKGDTVPITGLLEEATQYIENGEYFVFDTPEDVMWTLLIMGPDDLPISITSGILSSAMGYITLDTINYTIKQIDPSGTYTVRVVVWTSTLPDGDTRTYTINEGSFVVQ